jgi:hypothetical protein
MLSVNGGEWQAASADLAAQAGYGDGVVVAEHGHDLA